MITLVRDREYVYYALFEGFTEEQKDGAYTGSMNKVYGNVVQTKMPISGARTAYGFVSSVVQMEFFGMDKPYSKTMWTSDKNCPITEETIVWLGLGDVEDFDVRRSYIAGDKAIHDGGIYRCEVPSEGEFDPQSWTVVPHNYIVTGISESPNMIGYALKEVDLRD